MTPRSATMLGSALLLVCAIAPFAPSWPGPWLMDDLPLIVYNRIMSTPSRWGDFWTSDYWASTGYAARLYRPLTMTSYALNWAAAPNPASFRVINALLHAAVVVMFWLTLLGRRSGWIGLLGAAGFAMHPNHCDAVCNITGRAEILPALFLLMAIAVVRVSLFRPSWLLLGLFGMSTLGMMMSKETGLFLSCFPLVWLAVRRKGTLRSPALRNRFAALMMTLVGCLAAYLWARWYAVGAMPGGAAMTLDHHFKLSGSALLRSFTLILFPTEHRAVWRIPNLDSMGWLYPALGVAAFAVVAAAAVIMTLRRRQIGLPLLLLVLSMAPLAHPRPNIIWIWERGLYVPTMATWWLAAICVLRVCAGFPGRRQAAAASLAILLAAEAVATARQSNLFGSELRFWKRQHEIDPADTGTLTSYAGVLLRLARAQEAVGLQETAHVLDPRRGELVAALAGVYLRAGQDQRAAEFLTTASLSSLTFQSPRTKAAMLKQLMDSSSKCGALEAADRFLKMRDTPTPMNSTPTAK